MVDRRQVLEAGRKQVWVAGRIQVWVAGRRQVLVADRTQVFVEVHKQAWVADRIQVSVVDHTLVWEVDRKKVWADHISVSDLVMNQKTAMQMKQKRTGSYLVVHKLALVVSEVRKNWMGEGHTMVLVAHKKVPVVSNFLHH